MGVLKIMLWAVVEIIYSPINQVKSTESVKGKF